MAFCSELGKLRRQLVWIQNGKNMLSMQHRISEALYCRMDECVGEHTLVQLLLLFRGYCVKGRTLGDVP